MRDEEPPEITAQLLLQAYASGVFPMADNAQSKDIFWVDPELRGIIPLDALHISRSLRKSITRGTFDMRIDGHFLDVVRACAKREETWINDEIMALYAELHRGGYAHSVEAWEGDTLVGGLYGVAIGGAFFGESMFSHRTDASKTALVYLVARLRFGGFSLLDTQFVTDHLLSLGAIEISRKAYHDRLLVALRRPADFNRMTATAPQSVLQLSTQIS